MACHILLEDRTGSRDPQYTLNGNVLLDRLHGATISKRPGGADMAAEMERLADRVKNDGRKPYVIPGGGSNPVGALGYVNCALELLSQVNDMGLVPASVVHGTGSAGTQAGLVTGLIASRSGIPVLGIGVRAPKARQEEMVLALARGGPPTISGSATSCAASMSWRIATMWATATACPRRAWSTPCARWRNWKASCSIRSIPARRWRD